MRIERLTVLRYMGCGALLLGFVPPLALCAALFGRAPLENLPRIGWLLLCGLCAFAFNGLLRRKTSFTPILRLICLFAAALVLSCGVFLLTPNRWERLLLGALLFFGCLWGARFSHRDFSDMLEGHTFWKMLTLYGAFLFVPAIINHFFPIVYSQLLNTCCFFAFAAVYLLLHNQANIDSLTASRHYSFKFLPKRIRIYNIILVVIILLLIAGLFALAYLNMPDLSDALRRFKEWVASLFSGVPPPVERPPEIIAENNMGDVLSQLDDTEGGGIPWLGDFIKVLFTGVAIIGTAAVIFFNRSSIAWALRQLWQQLCELIAGLFQHVPSLRLHREETADYTDYDQSVSMEKAESSRAPSRLRQWKREVKRYQRMADSPEKYRRGYGLAVEGLSLCGAPVSEADTPLEIAGKASAFFEQDGFPEATEFFDLLQYGGRSYQPGRTSLLDRMLSELAALQKKSR